VTRRGRPLRFLALVAVGWVGVRAALLWPQIETLPDAIRAVVPFASAPNAQAPQLPATAQREAKAPSAPIRVRPALAEPPRRASDPMRVRLALLNLLEFGDPEYLDSPYAGTAAMPPIPPQQRRAGPAARRWSGSAWLVARPGAGLGAAPDGSQLGGGQAGGRLSYMLDATNRIALYGRFAAPLEDRGREAALGVEWQPSRLPVRLIAEQRIGVDGQRGGSGLGLVAGTDRRLPAGFALESYAQAGAVVRARVEPYADGAARATREIGMQGPLRFALGIGAWGAAQRDAARLDLGPSATLALPVAGKQFRLALDWRQRIAGDARPGSGLALTIGSDF
jgi:hypothetical protein